MTSINFAYWLQGYLEIRGTSALGQGSPGPLTSEQVDCIQKHLSLVFIHEIDQSQGDGKQQNVLNAIHSPAPSIGGVNYRC